MTKYLDIHRWSEGETWLIDAVLTTPDGQPLDMGNVQEIEWGVAATLSETPPPPVLATMTDGQITVVDDPALGKIRITVSVEDHTSITPGNWYHQCRCTLLDGTTLEQFSGPLEITQSIFV